MSSHAPLTAAEDMASAFALAAKLQIPPAFLTAHFCRTMAQLNELVCSPLPASPELGRKIRSLESAWLNMQARAGGQPVKQAQTHSAPPSLISDCITVFESSTLCGKAFTLNNDDSINKQSHANFSIARARVMRVSDASAMADVLLSIMATPNAGLILNAVKGIGIGDEFYIVPKDNLASMLGVAPGDRARLVGVHIIKGNKYIARLKENFEPTQWILLDRDVDAHTPEAFGVKVLPYAAWLSQVNRLLPGADSCERVWTPSSSARVTRPDGTPVGAGNGHTFLRATGDLNRIDSIRQQILARARLAGMSWKKPNKNGESPRDDNSTIIDPSVLTVGRLVFDGQPSVGAGLAIAPPDVQVHDGSPFDLDAIADLTDAQIAKHNAKSAAKLIRDHSGGLVTRDFDTLTLDTVLDFCNGKTGTVSEWLAADPKHTRIQSPFRGSHTQAAFIDLDSNGRPFVFDSGTDTSYYLGPPAPADVFHAINQPDAISASPLPATPIAKWPEPFPGPMACTVNAVLEASPKPRPVGAMLATLSSMASACNGHVRLESGGRLNLYTIILMPTGAGKDVLACAAGELAHAAGSAVTGPPASNAGIEDDLEDYRAYLMLVDEAGHLLAAANGSHAAPWLVGALAVLLKLYSNSAGVYHLRRLGNGGKPRPKDARMSVLHPCLNALLFTTPERFSSSVRLINIEEGLIGRALFHIDEQAIDQRRAKAFALPADVRAMLPTVQTATVSPPTDVGGSAGTAGENAAPVARDIVLAESPEATQALMACLEEINRDSRQGAADALEGMLLARSFEKIQRIAAVLAFWDAPTHPVLRADHVAWAKALVEASNSELLAFAAHRLSDSAVLADARKVLMICKRLRDGNHGDAKPNEAALLKQGLVPRRLALNYSHLGLNQFIAALAYLESVDAVSVGAVEPPGGGKPTTVLVVVDT
ncbi:DUF3987 domain-containing protein [Cupriavidus sp. SW-Y-13]|uniref:DUF3987 domain-containing protein n=1 Tax=Cupriavidus sp. SW-Y-13 TaxID=2653854 RepID=UPI0013658A89|nr:DUF3987 domain-containing protein [Cupriavidus sp. SW-Y-13]MWL88125.1 DUF3987 domain-containing protein [Cupriavidus sp. SW-Y-13]